MKWQSLGNHPMMDPPLFKRIGPYVFNLEDILGKGSFSKVYRGRNEQTCISTFTQHRQSQ
jgi:hypothetical protein